MFENDPDKKTRESALHGLAYLGDPVSVPLLIKALWNDNKTHRTYAVEGLARAGDKKALADLEKAAKVEKDRQVELALDFALTALGQDNCADLVKGLTSRPSLAIARPV